MQGAREGLYVSALKKLAFVIGIVGADGIGFTTYASFHELFRPGSLDLGRRWKRPVPAFGDTGEKRTFPIGIRTDRGYARNQPAQFEKFEDALGLLDRQIDSALRHDFDHQRIDSLFRL